MITGLQIMHLGRAVELLEMESESERGQVWRVRPLFVENQTPEVITIRPTDRCSCLHTNERQISRWRNYGDQV
jgi:hypothetical protein